MYSNLFFLSLGKKTVYLFLLYDLKKLYFNISVIKKTAQTFNKARIY